MSRIAKVTQVTVTVSTARGSEILVVTIGEVPTNGWTSPELAPWVYISPPTDGIQDFDFVAVAPELADTSLPLPLPAERRWSGDPAHYWGKDQPLRGVRVHAQEGAVVAMLERATAPTRPEGLPPWPIPWGQPGLPARGDAHAAISSLSRQAMTGKMVRVYRTGEPITKDFRRDRLNVELNPSTERVADLWFG